MGNALSFVPVRYFDLVVAAEVLYYLRDIDLVLDRMCLLGAACLVTYFNHHADRLDPFFEGRATTKASFSSEGTSWTARWWHNSPRA